MINYSGHNFTSYTISMEVKFCKKILKNFYDSDSEVIKKQNQINLALLSICVKN